MRQLDRDQRAGAWGSFGSGRCAAGGNRTSAWRSSGSPRIDPQLHSVIAVDPTAIEQARRIDAGNFRGPLAGRPVLIKDNIEVAGAMPTTAGSLALASNVTNRDAPLVARLRSAGAVILGKTNLSEWANIRANNSISGWSAVGGQVHNPWAIDRNPCGSVERQRRRGRRGPGAAGDRDRDRRLGHLPCSDQRDSRTEADGWAGQPDPYRADQPQPGHRGPMTASVREAAELLTAIAGSDPADPATAEADKRKRDYAASLDSNSLRGKRIGVMRFAAGFGTDAAFDTALAILRERGATLVEIKKFDDKAIGNNELTVLLTELKADLGKYLKGSPAPIPVRTLADAIAFNKAHMNEEMALFGQETFEKAQKTKGLGDPAYKKARAISFQAAGPNGIDRLLKTNKVDRAGWPDHAAGVEDRRGQRRPDFGRRRGEPGRGRGLSAPHRADGAGQRAAGGIELHRAEVERGAAALVGLRL